LNDVRTPFVFVVFLVLILLGWFVRRVILFALKGAYKNDPTMKKRTITVFIMAIITVLAAIPFVFVVCDMVIQWGGDIGPLIAIACFMIFISVGVPSLFIVLSLTLTKDRR
jgi:hypothetical protein